MPKKIMNHAGRYPKPSRYVYLAIAISEALACLAHLAGGHHGLPVIRADAAPQDSAAMELVPGPACPLEILQPVIPGMPIQVVALVTGSDKCQKHQPMNENGPGETVTFQRHLPVDATKPAMPWLEKQRHRTSAALAEQTADATLIADLVGMRKNGRRFPYFHVRTVKT